MSPRGSRSKHASPQATRRGRRGAKGARSRSRSRHGKGEKRCRDKDAPHFRWERGMRLGDDGRYIVHKLLGDGTFGRVLGCLDTVLKEKVAVKVVKGIKRYCEHAEAEAEVLTEIKRLDPGRQSLCVELRDTFLHPMHHFCLVFEPLGASIRDFLKSNSDKGLFAADVRHIAAQLLQSLMFLHAIGVTHTDLKCRNVMLHDASYDIAPHPRERDIETRRPRSCRIAVIDFGGAVFADERHSSRVGTRQFRAPEVVLGLPWDEVADIWSAGCIIAMLYTGQRPFSVHEDMEHLAMMEHVLGAEMPCKMIREATADGCLPEGVEVESNGRLVWPGSETTDGAVKRVRELPTLREQICARHRPFLALVQGLLQLNPKHRLSAALAVEYPFLVDEVVPE